MEGLNIQQIIRDTVREYESARRRVDYLTESSGEVLVAVSLRGTRSRVAADLRQMAELIERPNGV